MGLRGSRRFSLALAWRMQRLTDCAEGPPLRARDRVGRGSDRRLALYLDGFRCGPQLGILGRCCCFVLAAIGLHIEDPGVGY